MNAKIDRILSTHPTWKRSHLEALFAVVPNKSVANVRSPENYNPKNGVAWMIELFIDVCTIIESSGIALTEENFNRGLDADAFANKPDEIRDVVDIFNSFHAICQQFNLKFKNGINGEHRVYGHLHVDALTTKDRLLCVVLLRYFGESENKTATRMESDSGVADRVANLTIACGFNEFPSVQLVVYVSRVYGKTVEAIFQSLYVDSVDGIKQVINQVYNRCPAEYSMPSELLNLAVGSFLLTKGVMFGKFDTVKFSRKRAHDFTELQERKCQEDLQLKEDIEKKAEFAREIIQFCKENNFDYSQFMFDDSDQSEEGDQSEDDDDSDIVWL